MLYFNGQPIETRDIDTMTKMVDRVKRAIEAEIRRPGSVPIPEALARVAIAAMREPLGQMIIVAMGESNLALTFPDDADDMIVRIWETMIDEALK